MGAPAVSEAGFPGSGPQERRPAGAAKLAGPGSRERRP